jgi:hypothetical protein
LKTPLDIAVLNNIIWCGTVCEMHGVAHFTKGDLWGLKSKAPLFYPDIITTSPSVTAKEVVDFIGDRAVSSIKDSFSNLDMGSFGYRVLFDAEWIYHPRLSVTPSVDPNWRIIHNEEELAKWNSAAGLEEVIKPPFLKRQDIKIFSHEKEGQRSGFIANLGAEAVGISNVFSNDNLNGHLWSDIINVVSIEFPSLPMVGYEHGDDLQIAQANGWESIGHLRIWIKA